MKKKVLLIGWDAADWNIINPLLAEGKLPALEKLMKNGVYGNLSTMNPPYSPMLWTSVATGKTPDKHGVLGFIELDVEKQLVRPVTVTQRKVKAIWNILHNKGLKTNLVGWWPSHPAEPINGAIITDQFTKPVGKVNEPWPVNPGSVHPVTLTGSVQNFRIHPSEITPAHILPFIPNAAKIEKEDDKGLKIIAKLIAHNSSLHAASTWLMQNTEWDFMAIYYDMIDHFCHGFMNYHPPKLPQIKQERFEMYKDVVNSAYQFQDMMLERTLKLAGDEVLVIVMSDHGFVSDQSRMLVRPNVQAAAALDHREFGIFVASGPGIKKDQKIFGTSLLDMTPTILQYFDLPVGKDMDGAVMQDIFNSPTNAKFIDSWENVPGDFAVHKDAILGDPLSEQMAMDQLIELGYVDRPNANMEKAIRETKCDLQFNLARVYMGKREFDLAEKILIEIIEEDVNSAPYLVDLIHIMLIQKNYKRARAYLEKLRVLDPKSVVKTQLTEAKILFGEGSFKKGKLLLDELSISPRMTGTACYELGKMYMSLEEYDLALVQFLKAIEFKAGHAKYQQAIAVCYLRLDQPEKALDHALISIELVRYFPDAHYTIGEALEKLGDPENAKMAYATAEKLRPGMVRAKLAKENLIKQTEPTTLQRTDSNEFPEIIVVSGLPRSGTSMMMQMLHNGGIEVLSDGQRKEDNDNPKGYFEYEKTKSLHKNNDWLPEAQNKAIKVVAQLLKHLPQNFRYKIVFMTRDLNEVLASQQVMLKNRSKLPKTGVRNAFENELKKLDSWCLKEPGIELIKVDYKDVIEEPRRESERIKQFLGKDLDLDKMVQEVDDRLYRNRALKF